MNFQIPQFIEVEDKVFGPLSFKQFLYIVGGAGFGYLIYNLSFIPLFLRIIPVIGAVGLGIAMAFYKVNNRPLINAMESAFWYYLRGRLYLWKKDGVKSQPATNKIPVAKTSIDLPKFSESKLKELTWSLDVNEKVK